MNANPSSMFMSMLQHLFNGAEGQQAQPQGQGQPMAQPQQMQPQQQPMGDMGAGNRDFIQNLMNQQIMHGSHGQHTMLNMDGSPVNANAPTGIDWLNAHNNTGGHSWQQPGAVMPYQPMGFGTPPGFPTPFNPSSVPAQQGKPKFPPGQQTVSSNQSNPSVGSPFGAAFA